MDEKSLIYIQYKYDFVYCTVISKGSCRPQFPMALIFNPWAKKLVMCIDTSMFNQICCNLDIFKVEADHYFPWSRNSIHGKNLHTIFLYCLFDRKNLISCGILDCTV